jgi:hypothetical protein
MHTVALTGELVKKNCPNCSPTHIFFYKNNAYSSFNRGEKMAQK